MKDMLAWGMAIYISITLWTTSSHGGLIGFLVIWGIFVFLPMWGYVKFPDETPKSVMVGLLAIWTIVVSVPSRPGSSCYFEAEQVGGLQQVCD